MRVLYGYYEGTLGVLQRRFEGILLSGYFMSVLQWQGNCVWVLITTFVLPRPPSPSTS